MKTRLNSLNFIGKKTYALTLALLSMALMTVFLLTPAKTQAQTNIPLCEITRSLTVGARGEDVRCLQKYLNWSGYTIAAVGPGSPGSETDYFGSLTANALIKWQNANAVNVLTPLGLSFGTGYWGPSSFNWYVTIVKGALGVNA